MLADIVNLNVFTFMLIFARVGTAFSLMTAFGSSYVPVRVRLGLAMAVSFVVMPPLSERLPALPSSLGALALLVAGEVLIGAFFALISRIIMGALQVAGTFIAYFASLANALVRDPVAEQQSSVISSFLVTVGLVLVFATEMHHVMIRALMETYVMFEPGQALMMGDLALVLARRAADAFTLGFQLSAPLLIVAITYFVGLGSLGRLMPTLQVFFFGLPFQVTTQFLVMALAFSGMMMVFMEEFRQSYAGFAP